MGSTGFGAFWWYGPHLPLFVDLGAPHARDLIPPLYRHEHHPHEGAERIPDHI
jgi:hypothetical protein